MFIKSVIITILIIIVIIYIAVIINGTIKTSNKNLSNNNISNDSIITSNTIETYNTNTNNTNNSLSPLLHEVNRRLQHILAMSKIKVDYNLIDHPELTFAEDKKDISLCSSCVIENSNNIPKIDRLLYMTLHEVSHVINKGENHDENFEQIFKSLLLMAAKLGYLDAKRLRL